MSDGWLFTQSYSGGYHGNGPITGPDGQPILVAVGDLGDTLVSGSGGISNTGTGGTPAAPIAISGSNLTINVTYDQTSGLPSGFVSAINYVVAYYETLFTTPTPTTVNIDIGYGEIGGQALEANALGESESFLAGYSYSTIKSALASTDSSAAASLPASQPVSGTMWVSTAEVKALGLTPAQPATNLDGYAGFSSSLPFTYDPTNRAVAGQYDFIGVVEHEFTEIMGRIDLFNATLSDGTQTIAHAYSLLDMYHYTSIGVHTYTGTTPNYFSADGGHTNLIAFNSNPSGDLGDWASSADADSFLAFSPSGEADIVSQADVTTMNVLGYQSAVLTPVTIESFGSTALVGVGSNYEMNPIGGGAGPMLYYGGALVTAGEFGGWMPIGAETTGGGYEVAWKVSGQDAYTVWDIDGSGNYVSNATAAVVTGNSAALESLEPSFHQDLNGDGTIGIVAGAIAASENTNGSGAQGTGNFLSEPEVPILGIAGAQTHGHDLS